MFDGRRLQCILSLTVIVVPNRQPFPLTLVGTLNCAAINVFTEPWRVLDADFQ